MPPTMPVVEPTVPTAVLLLVHVPPEVASVNTSVDPTHITPSPPIGPAIGCTVTITVAGEQPPVSA